MVDFGDSPQTGEKGPVRPESLAREEERYFGTRIPATEYIGVSVCLYVYLCVTWGAKVYFRCQNNDFWFTPGWYPN